MKMRVVRFNAIASVWMNTRWYIRPLTGNRSGYLNIPETIYSVGQMLKVSFSLFFPSQALKGFCSRSVWTY